MWHRELVPSLRENAEQSELTALNNNTKNMLKTLALTCALFLHKMRKICKGFVCVSAIHL